MLGLDVIFCNWGVLFAPSAAALFEFDKESVGVNEILCTDLTD